MVAYWDLGAAEKGTGTEEPRRASGSSLISSDLEDHPPLWAFFP
jgi:hypothetical protein